MKISELRLHPVAVADLCRFSRATGTTEQKSSGRGNRTGLMSETGAHPKGYMVWDLWLLMMTAIMSLAWSFSFFSFISSICSC